MANRRSGKLWTPGLLKSRGWTKELMAQLLPRPQYRRFNGRSVPHWHRDDVRAAEATAAFQAKSRGALPRGADLQAAAAAAQAAAALLGRAWQDAPREETWPWVLAGYYHQAIVSHLPAAARGRGLRSNQISGFLRRSPGRVGQSPVSRGSPGRRGTGHRQLHRRPAGGRSAGAAADEGLSRLSAALPNLGLSLLRLLCSPSHPHQLRGPHGPEPQGRVP